MAETTKKTVHVSDEVLMNSLARAEATALYKKYRMVFGRIILSTIPLTWLAYWMWKIHLHSP